jgi:hypothetical protein
MFDQPPDEYIPQPYLTSIGKVCVDWGRLETVVDLAIAKLAAFDTLDPRGAIITAHMPWPLKMDVLEALVTALRPNYPALAKFDEAKPLLKKAQEGRNRIVHGQWGERDGKVLKARITARGRVRSSLHEITVSEIDAISTDVFRAGRAVLKAVFDA